MRRVWTSVLAVWAMLAIVAVLAWTRQPVQPSAARPVAQTLVLRTKHGTQRFVVVGASGAAAPHATTQTSPPPVA